MRPLRMTPNTETQNGDMSPTKDNEEHQAYVPETTSDTIFAPPRPKPMIPPTPLVHRRVKEIAEEERAHIPAPREVEREHRPRIDPARIEERRRRNDDGVGKGRGKGKGSRKGGRSNSPRGRGRGYSNERRTDGKQVHLGADYRKRVDIRKNAGEWFPQGNKLGDQYRQELMYKGRVVMSP